MRPTGTLVAVVVTHFVIGWHWGYRDLSTYGLSWLLAALAFLASRNIVNRLFRQVLGAEFAVRMAIVSFALIVLCGLILGWLGRLSTLGFIVAQAALLMASFALPVRQQESVRPSVVPLRIPAWVVGIVGALLAFATAFAIGHAPLTLYDSVSYHLFFAVRWLQDHTLSIIPTPFSDVAQAYAPANGELFFVWLMAPLHGDLLARFGQWPFAGLGALTLFLLARRLGAAAEHAVYPAAFFVLSRPILEQAIGANVDLICATLFLTSVYFGLLAHERNQVADWIFWGVSVGLCLGTKYAALVYTPVLILLGVVPRPRWKVLWALAGVTLFAMPWYIRNWEVAGSPLYPAGVSVAGLTVARGAFTHAAMLNTVFHTNDPRLLPTIAARAFGPTLFVVWIPVAVVGGVRLLQRGWWPHAFVFLIPWMMLPLFWFGFPVNVDARFFMPAIAPALLPFAFVFRDDPRWNRAVHAIYAAAIAWILIGTGLEIRAAVPWFMSGWWTLGGLLPSRFVGWFAVLALLIAAAWRLVVRPLPLAAGLIAASVATLAIGGESWCSPARCDYLDTTPTYIQMDLVDAWNWTAENVRQSTVAYTGINLPYPLTGDRLTNRVVYVNTDGHPRWRFHDYDRAYREGRFTPSAPALATSSGELLPVVNRSGPRTDALRPRYDRMQGTREFWIDNLRRLKVDHLFVAALSAYEINYVSHNAGGFPIEDDWASSDPRTFRLEFQNRRVRMYAVDLSEARP